MTSQYFITSLKTPLRLYILNWSINVSQNVKALMGISLCHDWIMRVCNLDWPLPPSSGDFIVRTSIRSPIIRSKIRFQQFKQDSKIFYFYHFMIGDISNGSLMQWCQWVSARDITPLLTHWSYVFRALTHQCIIYNFYVQFQKNISNSSFPDIYSKQHVK